MFLHDFRSPFLDFPPPFFWAFPLLLLKDFPRGRGRRRGSSDDDDDDDDEDGDHHDDSGGSDCLFFFNKFRASVSFS